MTAPDTEAMEAVDALQRALAAEHAAIWVGELATAFLTADLVQALSETAAAHRSRRDTTARLLRDRGATPVPAEPAYADATQVTDANSALALLVVSESDAAAAWRSLIERTDDTALRELAVVSLTDAAVRATRWRRSARMAQLTVPFPGTS